MEIKSYIVTSGWWCADAADDKRAIRHGDEKLREVDFFESWYAAIVKNSNPKYILVIDSNSPIKPDLHSIKKKSILHWWELDENGGHSTRHTGKYAGVTRAHILGMISALMSDVDYWVYIEQDALIHGEGIIEYAISKMRKPYMFGSGWGTPQPMQQSFMIMKKEYIPKFLENFFRINAKDGEISPELKFAIAASPILRGVPEIIYKKIEEKGIFSKILSRLVFEISNSTLGGFQALPFGYGRVRPINFDDKYLYFQHGSDSELRDYFNLKS